MPVFQQSGDSSVVSVTDTDTRVELPSLPSDNPAIRLVDLQAGAAGSALRYLWVKLGGAAVSGSKTTSMLIAPGTLLAPQVLGVGSSDTHLSVFADGAGGDMLLTPGRIVEGAATGATGEAAGLGFIFSDNTSMADPGSGQLRFDDGTVASVENIAIDDESRDGVDVSSYLTAFDDSTSTVKGHVIITVSGDPSKLAIFQVDDLTDNSGWVQIEVTHVASSGTIANDDEIQVEFRPKGDKGDTGLTGSTGPAAGFLFNFDSSTSMADPGSGDFRLNDGTLSSVTAAAVSDNSADSGNPDVSAAVLAWDDSDSDVRGQLIIRKTSAPENFAIYDIDGASTDNSGWVQLSLSYVDHSGSFSDTDECLLAFVRTGDKGETGDAATIEAGTTTQADSQTAADVTNSGTTSEAVFDFTIPQGEAGGIRFTFDDGTSMADPGDGDIRFDNATVSSVSNIAVDDQNADGVDVSAYLLTFDDSTSTVKGYLILVAENDGSKFAIFQVDSLTDNSGWVQLGVTYVDHAGSFSDSDSIRALFIRTGDKGDKGDTGDQGPAGEVTASGTPSADEYARWTDATTIEGRTPAEVRADLDLEIGTDVLAQQTIGIADDNLLEVDGSPNDDEYARFTANGLEGRTAAQVRDDLSLGDLATQNTVNNDDWSGTDLDIGNGGTGESTAAAAFGALKQDATESATGVTEFSTTSEVRAAGASDDTVIRARKLREAAALVSLSESGGSVAVDWESGVNFSLTLDGDHTISNPSNGIPGTWRTIIMVGNDGTDRSPSFGSEFEVAPELTDVNSTNAYLVSIYCITASRFRAYADEGGDPT